MAPPAHVPARLPTRMLRLTVLVTAIALTAGCVAPVGPVEVTRFLREDAPLGRGAIAVVPAASMDAAAAETGTWGEALRQQLARVGYAPLDPGANAGAAPRIAEFRVVRALSGNGAAPVSVGLGGGAGSYGSGVGVGLSIPLGRTPRPATTTLSLRIVEVATGRVEWEGRAQFTVDAHAPVAETALAAPKLAAALLSGFPGRSGETIEVP